MHIIDSFLILSKTPRLVICKISGASSLYTGKSLGTVLLTSLKSFELMSLSSVGNFLNNLIAPHLEECSLSGFRYESNGFVRIEPITSFLGRSASLRSFLMVLRNFRLGIMNLLQSMPSLTTLSMILRPCTDSDTESACDPTVPITTSGQNHLLAEYISSARIFTKPQGFGIFRRPSSTSRKLRRPTFLTTRRQRCTWSFRFG
jgi:hypothetical protein